MFSVLEENPRHLDLLLSAKHHIVHICQNHIEYTAIEMVTANENKSMFKLQCNVKFLHCHFRNLFFCVARFFCLNQRNIPVCKQLNEQFLM